MTDDIVTRLRKLQVSSSQLWEIDVCKAMDEAADEIDLWRGVAQSLAQEVLKTFDGHRSTNEMKAYAEYLKAKG